MAGIWDVEIEIVGQAGREREGTFSCPDHKNVMVFRLRRVERGARAGNPSEAL
jgi:hypothetical protein